MTTRGLIRLLWAALIVCAPMPFFLVEIGLQPVAAILQMLGVTLVLMAAYGGAGAITLTAWILGAQVLLAIVALGIVASVVTHILVRALGSRASFAVYAIVAALFVVAFTVPIYRTPFRTGGLQSTLAQVFE
jgi:hypothetical protein